VFPYGWPVKVEEEKKREGTIKARYDPTIICHSGGGGGGKKKKKGHRLTRLVGETNQGGREGKKPPPKKNPKRENGW